MKNFFTFEKINKTARCYVIAVLWFFILAGLVSAAKFAMASADALSEDLRQKINEIQQQIDSYRANISDLQQQSKTLKGEISLLDSKTKAMNLEIQRTDLSIKQAEREITDKNVAIDQSELKLVRERNILGEYVRAVNEYDQRGGLMDIIFDNSKISDIFEEINSMESAQQKIQESMVQIQETKVVLEQDINYLEDKRDEFNQLKVLQEIQRRSVVSQQQEKKDLLNQTKGQENNFQALIKKSQTDVQAIKSQLYLLEGVGAAMSLEKAYQYAKRAADLTGVRPAFLLAVLKKESSWGEKVGTGFWRQSMHSRDKDAFVQICEELGRDPDKTPVSRKPAYGWGGAMGPAQFLPSVWLQYKNQVAQLTGHNPPDPWDIEDAFVAAAIKLSQGGANAQTDNAEWKAAQIYFAGKRWNNSAYYFYGDQVMELAGVIQEQLNLILK